MKKHQRQAGPPDAHRGSRRGQAMVEYILLLSVIVGVVALFGKTMDTEMTRVLKTYVEGIGSPKAASGGRAMHNYYQTNSGTAGDAKIVAK